MRVSKHVRRIDHFVLPQHVCSEPLSLLAHLIEDEELHIAKREVLAPRRSLSFNKVPMAGGMPMAVKGRREPS